MDVGVDHGRLEVPVAQEQLDLSDIDTISEQVCGKRVAQGVDGGVLVNLCLGQGGSEGALDIGFRGVPSQAATRL